MRAPLSWIKDFVDLDETPQQIAAAFDQLGIEVEGVEVIGEGVTGIKVAEVKALHPHPNADRLRLVDIDDGIEPTTVVCGAPNLAVGMRVPYARSGATVADAFKMEKRKIRGVLSDGMLCSAKDLGLSDDHGGIVGLPTDAPLGSDPAEMLGVGEVVFELSITPNRPDAMCMVGLARELAAHFGKQLRVPDPVLKTSLDAGAPTVEVRDGQRCPRYVGWRARVVPGASPEWMARRLTLAGMRPIDVVVDVTNYVLLERNQPLHAFDFDKIKGGVIVRLAKDAESITTLDGKERRLTSDDLVICDADDKPQAIAGIMGGENSEISRDTTEIVLEAAYFSPHGVGVSSRRLGLRTEASSRFDRGLDPCGVEASATRAMELLELVAGAEVASTHADVVATKFEPLSIDVRTSRVNSVLGVQLDAGEVRALLGPLGFGCTGEGDDFAVVAPTYRPDITREIDVIEEVARRVGYSNIVATMPSISFQQGFLTPAQKDRRAICDVLVHRGFMQAKCFPLVAPGDVAMFGVANDDQTRVANPLRAEESVLTPTLLPGLLKSVAHNLRQKVSSVALFELDTVFGQSNDLLMDESINLAVVLAGHDDARPLAAKRPYDAYDVTSALAAVRDALGLASLELSGPAAVGFEAGKSSGVTVDGVECGSVGVLAKKCTRYFGIDVPVVALELSTDKLASGKRLSRVAKAISTHPPVFFDLAFVADSALKSGELVAAIRRATGELGEEVKVFDIFEGPPLDEGHKSIAVSVTLRAPDRTLSDADIKPVREACIKKAGKLGAQVRGA